MRDQLKLLEELQRHDARLQELETLMRALPQKLATAENALGELEKLLARERAEFLDSEAFRKSQEEEQKDANDQLGRAKAKLSQVKNLKESNAATREMEATRRQLDTREEEVQKLASVIEEQRHKIGEHESKLEADRRELTAERDTVDKRLNELNAEIAEARGERDVLAKQVRPDVLKRYGTIRMRRGLAVVAVRDGTCRGCNMNIPPQLYNTLQRGNSIELCPNCNRIIYWSRLLEEHSETA